MTNRDLAERIVRALLSTGAGAGSRLAVMLETEGDERERGGWCPESAIREVEHVLARCSRRWLRDEGAREAIKWALCVERGAQLDEDMDREADC